MRLGNGDSSDTAVDPGTGAACTGRGTLPSFFRGPAEPAPSPGAVGGAILQLELVM